MLTSISSRVSWKLIASPQIKKAADLRGKRFGVQSIVGSTWMYAMLALEELGLEPKRDNISFLPIGDPVTIGHALEAGRIDAAVLDPALSRRLASKGFTQLVDLAKTDASFPGLGLGLEGEGSSGEDARGSVGLLKPVASLFLPRPDESRLELVAWVPSICNSGPPAGCESHARGSNQGGP